ncbi:uncharacterized protein LOC132190324 [Corylus avellana]|uniref:uncharacterized protein LOC132190324 n=1 Tax=Corylus avellana TaxID=13451 RepID=UPI00286C216C|nr:uncharacterized protein LOC132190324 [Corylus avellana]
MIDSLLRSREDDFSPRVSVGRHRRFLALSISPLLIVDGLSRKGFFYKKLPTEPLKLSVLKLDGSCFDIEVTKTATVAELKQAVEAVFSHMPQKGPGKISWSHLWGRFCLCYDGEKLVTETDSIRNYGIKDGDQLHFVRHISNSYILRKRSPKKRVFVSWQRKTSLSRSNSREDGEPNDEEDDDCGDIEKGKPRRYKKNDKCLIQRRVSRMAHLFGGWFLYTSKRRRIVGLACPPGVGTSLVGGFRKIILFCRKNRFSPRDTWRED